VDTGTKPCGGTDVVCTSLPAKRFKPVQFVAGDEAFDLVKQGERIEGAELGFQAVSFKPDGVAVSLAGLRPRDCPRSAVVEVRLKGTRMQRLRPSRLRGEPVSQSPVLRLRVRRLADHLHVAVGVGHRAGFFVEACCGEDNVGKCCGLGQKNILNDNKGVFNAAESTLRVSTGLEPTTSSAARFPVAAAANISEMDLPGVVGRPAYSLNAPARRRESSRAAGPATGPCLRAAGVGVVAEIREADVSALCAPCDQFFDGRAAELRAEDYDQ